MNPKDAPVMSKKSTFLSKTNIAETITMGWLVTKRRLCANEVWSRDQVHAAKCTARAKPERKISDTVLRS